jgi:hypothetical protein
MSSKTVFEEIKNMSERDSERLNQVFKRMDFSVLTRVNAKPERKVDACQSLLHNPASTIEDKKLVFKIMSRLQDRCLCTEIRKLDVELLTQEYGANSAMVKGCDKIVYCYHCDDKLGLSSANAADEFNDWQNEKQLHAPSEAQLEEDARHRDDEGRK